MTIFQLKDIFSFFAYSIHIY